MELTKKIHSKLEKILTRLKVLEVIESFKLEINFCQVEENFKTTLCDIDSILKKCLRKILTKPRKAEIRNVITELVRKKNLNHPPVFLKDEEKCLNGMLDLEFYCRDCDIKFEDKENWLDHKKTHKRKRTYLCDKCGECFDSFLWWKNHYQEHLKINPVAEGQIFAESLQRNEKNFEKEFENSCEHVLDPTADSKFICKCGKEFRLLKSLRKHESVKHSAKNIIFNCTICKKSFKEKGKLNRHMLSHSKSQYKCCYCLKRFTRSDSLKRHLSLAHHPQKYFSCGYCQKKFNLKYNKDVHEENIHKKINNWIQCDQCGKKFKNKITFKTHLKIHLEKRFICKVCGKSFARKIQLSNHLKNLHFHLFSNTMTNNVLAS